MSMPWDTENAAGAIYSRVLQQADVHGFGGAPRAAGSKFPGAVMLAPMDPRWSPEEKERFLRSHNYAFITALMPHEVYPGHGWWRCTTITTRAGFEPTRARIAISLVLLRGVGVDAGLRVLSTRQTRRVPCRNGTLKLWRYARVIYDAGMHLGYVSVEEGVNLMTSDVMFAEPYSFLQVQGATHGYARTGIATWDTTSSCSCATSTSRKCTSWAARGP